MIKCFNNKTFSHRLTFAEIIDQELEHGEKAQQFVEQMMRGGYEVGIIQEALASSTVQTHTHTLILEPKPSPYD